MNEATHWNTMTFCKEIEYIQEIYSCPVLLIRKIINVKTLKALCRSHYC